MLLPTNDATISVQEGQDIVTWSAAFDLREHGIVEGHELLPGTGPWTRAYRIRSVDYDSNTAQIEPNFTDDTIVDSPNWAIRAPSALSIIRLIALVQELLASIGEMVPSPTGADRVLTLVKDTVGDVVGVELRTGDGANRRWRLVMEGNDNLRLRRSEDGNDWIDVLTVPLDSGRITLSEPITLPGAPTEDNHAATKAYVTSGAGLLIAPETQAWIAACEEPPSLLRALLVDHIVTRLIKEGVWLKLDLLYLLAAHTSQAARINVRAPSTFILSEAGGLTFDVNRGYTGNGTDARLETGYNPQVQTGGAFQQDSAHFAALTLDNTSVNDFVIGQATGNSNRIRPRGADGDYQARINSSSGVIAPSLRGDGFFLANRSASAAEQHYRNGGLLIAASNTSGIPANSQFTLLFGGTGWSARGPMAAACFGGSLTADEVEALNDILQFYMMEIGA